MATRPRSERKRGAGKVNFIFILADDLGHADLGCYGGRENCSPNLDRLATEGVIFTNGYANSSVCSPSRFAIATGRWQHRLRGGADEPISVAKPSPVLGLPPGHPTLASLLRDAGYATALIGKWHLGHLPYFGPLKSGYQEFFGFMGRGGLLQSRVTGGSRPLGRRRGGASGRPSHRSPDRAGDRFHKEATGKAVPPLAALQCAALAVGDP